MAKSKKDKAQAENQEINNSEEHVPPTIVEGSMEEVFASPEIVNEQPAPARQKVSKRPYIDDVEILLSAGTLTKRPCLNLSWRSIRRSARAGPDIFAACSIRNTAISKTEALSKQRPANWFSRTSSKHLLVKYSQPLKVASTGRITQISVVLFRSRLGLGNIHNQKKGEHMLSHIVITLRHFSILAHCGQYATRHGL